MLEKVKEVAELAVAAVESLAVVVKGKLDEIGTREPQSTGTLVETPVMSVRHLRTHDLRGRPDNKGGITIAYFDRGEETFYAVSYCSPEDNFCRKIGSTSAKGRLAKAKYPSRVGLTKDQFEVQLDAVAESLHLSNHSLISELHDRIEIDIPAAYIGERRL
jgi:hypothetical protein